MKVALALLMASAVLIVSHTHADADKKGPHDDAIEARQALMQVYKYYWLPLNEMSKGKLAYDEKAAVIAADNLLSSVRLDQTGMWPKGSHNEDAANLKNATLPSLWKASPKALEKADKLMIDGALEMQAAAGKGLKSLKKAMKNVNRGCKSCHDDYRQKDD